MALCKTEKFVVFCVILYTHHHHHGDTNEHSEFGEQDLCQLTRKENHRVHSVRKSLTISEEYV